MSTIQKILQDFQSSGHLIADLGKSVHNQRFYLAFNNQKGWYLRPFNGLIGRIQLFLRSLFGLYGDTHLGHIAKKLNSEIAPKEIPNNLNYCALYRTLSSHWHRSTPFAWEIDSCVNCFAKERFKETNGKRHPFCGKTCAAEFKLQPRSITEKPPSSEIIPGFTYDKLLNALKDYAKKGPVDFYEYRYKPVTSIFGNFHPCPVSLPLAGKTYTFACSEAAFQAHKFITRSDLIQEFVTLNGDGAFRKARDLQPRIRSDWKAENVNVMRAVLKAKFEQNSKLKQLLLATGSAILIEHTARDDFWGDKGDGTGKNKLGELLMELRTQLGGPSVDFAKIDYPCLVKSL